MKLFLSLALMTSALASASSLIQYHDDAKLGRILTDSSGMTLYIFTKDAPDVSNCYDQCAVNWPPLTLQDAKDLPDEPGYGLIKRKDGAFQVTYNSWPLYYWVKDQKAGDTTGQAVGKVWWVANQMPLITVQKDTAQGNVLAGPNNMTLYIFTKDEGTTSNCYDQCATNWPPLLVSHEIQLMGTFKSRLGVTTRKDGTLQVTLDGKPVYYWVKDQKAGDTTGQAVGNVWWVIQDEAAK
ncbi:hypothetical protein [Deinococcus roseus]|uniref:Lipoprotein n=1 Tax=Deinococcus roseus TaxID=392414 RepID=A0ABQ2DK87_9DEIO|nr:hypothetical protein [Deinococcus roseus]GGJ60001.1 hypothetical protein GCM10008938_52660 [Deinococcus roseus]